MNNFSIILINVYLFIKIDTKKIKTFKIQERASLTTTVAATSSLNLLKYLLINQYISLKKKKKKKNNYRKEIKIEKKRDGEGKLIF